MVGFWKGYVLCCACHVQPALPRVNLLFASELTAAGSTCSRVHWKGLVVCKLSFGGTEGATLHQAGSCTQPCSTLTHPSDFL